MAGAIDKLSVFSSVLFPSLRRGKAVNRLIDGGTADGRILGDLSSVSNRAWLQF